MLLWSRKVRLTATGASGITVNPGTSTDDQVKIGFSVVKSLSSSANEATIRVWNLSEGHRNAMGRALEDVRLEAGYVPGEDGTGVIFEGQIRKAKHTREGGDIITTLECGDGDRGLRRGAVSQFFPAGAPGDAPLRFVADAFKAHGVRVGEMKLPALPSLRRPYAMWGSARREMDRLCREARVYWSIQNGTLETLPGDGWLSGVQSFDGASGLVGVPAVTDNGVEAEVLLSPGIRPGRQVRIVSDLVDLGAEDGLFRVSAVTFTGDNHEGPFLAKITGEAVRGGKVDEGGRQ